MTDIYGGGRYLRRWQLVEGRARCPLDALDLRVASEAAIGAVLAINRAVAATVVAVEAYETAVRLVGLPQPPQWVPAADADGLVEGAAWLAWTAAVALVEGAGAGVRHLARTRAGMLEPGEDGFELDLPAMGAFDPRAETVDLIEGAWVVRALTEGELATHPLRPAAFMSKMAFAALLIEKLGDALGNAVLGMYGSVLSLASDVDWIDVFVALNGNPAKLCYADQLLNEGAVTEGNVAALRAGWRPSCRA